MAIIQLSLEEATARFWPGAKGPRPKETYRAYRRNWRRGEALANVRAFCSTWSLTKETFNRSMNDGFPHLEPDMGHRTYPVKAAIPAVFDAIRKRECRRRWQQRLHAQWKRNALHDGARWGTISAFSKTGA